MIKEQLIVTLTTYSKRIQNIPAVLDTIFQQTQKPELVVLNLANDEIIPENILQYINTHNIEVNRMSDTKVYKKLIPTLKKHPEACVISIDDDWLYPPCMIEDFMDVHLKYPDNPISGNRQIHFQMQCHCGCASLTKADYFGEFLDFIDDELIRNCPSDDIVYTYLANKNNHPYIRTKELYFTNMESYQAIDSYSHSDFNADGINRSYRYLIDRFGGLNQNFVCFYINDEKKSEIIFDIYKRLENKYLQTIQSRSYKFAQKLNNVYSRLKKILHFKLKH